MKEWECVQLGHHKNIGKTIEEWEHNGWRLHTYQAQGTPTIVNHYLLFEREIKSKPLSEVTVSTVAVVPTT